MASLWVAAFDLERLKRLRRSFAQQSARHPNEILSLMVLQTSAFDIRIFSDTKIRDELTAFSQETEGKIRASATVIEGTGFVASAVRSAGWGIRLAMRSKLQLQFFDNSPSAIRWLVSPDNTVRTSLREADLLAMIREMESRVGTISSVGNPQIVRGGQFTKRL